MYFLEVQFTNQMIGRLFVSGIGGCFIAFGIFKFGLHYKIASVGRFATAFYYAAFEYKKVQTTRLSSIRKCKRRRRTWTT
jgi:hypothetical protein